ncbi:MAG: hypothetical protein WDA17_01475 [Sphaerochaetaceae bacterium]
MKKIFILIIIVSVSLNSLFSYDPTDAELKVALQALAIATASSMASNNFDKPIFDRNLTYFNSDTSFSNMELFLNEADIGLLRLTVLQQKAPEIKQQGFFATLLSTITSLKPRHEQLVAFLEPHSALLQEEVIISGSLKANRVYTTYFHFNGEGFITVSGKRFNEPFTLELAFTIPLEGKEAFNIIPIKVKSENKEYKEVAQKLFQIK